MAKKFYIGDNSIAHQVKQAYIGIDDTARKIKKAYIGVNGIAQKFYENLTLVQTTKSTAKIQLNSFTEGAKTLTGYITGLSNTYTPTVTWTTNAPGGFILDQYDDSEAIAFKIWINGRGTTMSVSSINTRLASTTYDEDTYMEIMGASGCPSGNLYTVTIMIDFGRARSYTLNRKQAVGTGNTGDCTCYVSSDKSTWTSASGTVTNKRYFKIELTKLERFEAYPWSYLYFSNITDWIYQ